MALATDTRGGRPVLELTLDAPVTRWSQQSLAQRRSLLSNSFELKVTAAYLEACGLPAQFPARAGKTQFQGYQVRHTLVI